MKSHPLKFEEHLSQYPSKSVGMTASSRPNNLSDSDSDENGHDVSYLKVKSLGSGQSVEIFFPLSTRGHLIHI